VDVDVEVEVGVDMNGMGWSRLHSTLSTLSALPKLPKLENHTRISTNKTFDTHSRWYLHQLHAHEAQRTKHPTLTLSKTQSATTHKTLNAQDTKSYCSNHGINQTTGTKKWPKHLDGFQHFHKHNPDYSSRKMYIDPPSYTSQQVLQDPTTLQ
jgi:hypothetical protein